MLTVINSITSEAITPAEQALGTFTRRKLKTMDTWNEWEQGERKQLNQFHDLQMFGEHMARPLEENAIILRSHWQYHVKRDGQRRARQCCDGSKRAAPILHALAKTYSSCVEHPIQRQFLALAAQQNFLLFGGDAKDAFAHSPAPEVPTYMTIDNQYYDWYFHKFNKRLDRSRVLPVLRALQGHPESGKLWERHINDILLGPALNFKHTTHDRTIYQTTFNGNKVLLLRMVDDLLLQCEHEETAKAIYKIIGLALQLENEDEPPFAYLGPCVDFNGVDIEQSNTHIMISCQNYIDRMLRAHGWNISKKKLSTNLSPLPDACLKTIYNECGPDEGTVDAYKLKLSQGFAYCTLLGEMMYAYVTCRPDIGYVITTMSKFSTKPSKYHYELLKGIAKYLRETKTWGIKYTRSTERNDLYPASLVSDVVADEDLPPFPVDINPPILMAFVDAAYANDQRKRRSTTGFVLTYCGGAIVYRSKTQSVTALSSTEAEFFAAVSCAKIALYIRSILFELGFACTGATPIYEDNKSTIDIVNSSVPTERARHVYIQYFAIQDWKEWGCIELIHIPGILNPSDTLTKPLGWVLHSRHCRRFMGHYA